jgi:hypothetical protein
MPGRRSALGAERVRYYLQGTDFYRQRSRVVSLMQLNPQLDKELEQMQENVDRDSDSQKGVQDNKIDATEMFGDSALLPFLTRRNGIKFYTPVEEPPDPPELLAMNVKSFDVKYGYYFGKKWKETDHWDSDAKEFRTPPFNLEPTDPAFLSKMLAYETREPDHLPAYVRIRLRIGDQTDDGTKKKSERSQSVETLVWMPGALEVYTPSDDDYFQPTENTEGSDSVAPDGSEGMAPDEPARDDPAGDGDSGSKRGRNPVRMGGRWRR